MKIGPLKIVSLAALALAMSACGGGGAGTSPPVAVTPPPPPPPAPPSSAIPYPAGISEARITVGGVERSFLVHVPAGLTQARAMILVLHGGGGSGAQSANFFGNPQAVFRSIADREGLVAVYPNALANNWNDCRGDAPGIASAGDDVSFFDALLTRLQSELKLDTRRTFLSGNSNGAMMSMRYALERSERVAAIAVSSGNLAAAPKGGRCTTGPAAPVPILLTHGALDPIVPYDGGCVAVTITIPCTQGNVISAEATRDRWLAFNGLASTNAVVTRFEVNLLDGGAAVQSRYIGTAPVEWWRLEGAGHTPPSRTIFLDSAIVGIQNRDVEFAEIAWSFFAARLP